jgi:hypothetical protein
MEIVRRDYHLDIEQYEHEREMDSIDDLGEEAVMALNELEERRKEQDQLLLNARSNRELFKELHERYLEVQRGRLTNLQNLGKRLEEDLQNEETAHENLRGGLQRICDAFLTLANAPHLGNLNHLFQTIQSAYRGSANVRELPPLGTLRVRRLQEDCVIS